MITCKDDRFSSFYAIHSSLQGYVSPIIDVASQDDRVRNGNYPHPDYKSTKLVDWWNWWTFSGSFIAFCICHFICCVHFFVRRFFYIFFVPFLFFVPFFVGSITRCLFLRIQLSQRKLFFLIKLQHRFPHSNATF